MIIGNMDGLPDDLGADLVLINGNILTIDPEESIVEALAVKDGKFLMVGTNNHVLKSRGKLTQVVDLKRKTVLPGYIGCHNHVPARPKWFDLYWVRSMDKLVGLLRTWGRTSGSRGWTR